MTPYDLLTLRVALGFANQTEMAEAIGLKLRAYQDLEGGKSPIRKIHELALDRVTLRRAAEVGEPLMLPRPMYDEVVQIARLIEGFKAS